jgi:hypothetical protein
MVERTAMAESPESLDSQPSAFNKLCEIVAKLRAPGGCPWDREQTHESLLPALIEEAYEVAGCAPRIAQIFAKNWAICSCLS